MERFAFARRHDEVHGDALERQDLVAGLFGDRQVGRVSGQRAAAVGGAGLALHRPGESADQRAGDVLQLRQRLPGAVEMRREHMLAPQPLQSGDQQVGVPALAVPLARDLHDAVHDAGVGQDDRIERPGGDGVLHVMHRVGDVVGQVHHLAFHRLGAGRSALLEPAEHVHVVRVDAEFHAAAALRMRRSLRIGPWVLDRRVQRSAGQVHAGGTPVVMEHLGLQPGEQPQRLCIAFEPADAGGDGRQRLLAVVSERRMTQIVRQAGAVDHVGVAAEHRGDLPSDLGDLQRVRQPRAREIVGAGDQHLAFRTEPTQRGGMDEPGAVAFEGGAVA